MARDSLSGTRPRARIFTASSTGSNPLGTQAGQARKGAVGASSRATKGARSSAVKSWRGHVASIGHDRRKVSVGLRSVSSVRNQRETQKQQTGVLHAGGPVGPGATAGIRVGTPVSRYPATHVSASTFLHPATFTPSRRTGAGMPAYGHAFVPGGRERRMSHRGACPAHPDLWRSRDGSRTPFPVIPMGRRPPLRLNPPPGATARGTAFVETGRGRATAPRGRPGIGRRIGAWALDGARARGSVAVRTT
jgi:hypothetical protein